jgi:CHAD domain-containing protein
MSTDTQPGVASPPGAPAPPEPPEEGPAAPPVAAGASPTQDGAAFGDLSVAVAGARLMLEQLDRLEAHERGARSGADPEDVHRMRVATRRLRAARRVFRGALTAAPDLDLERANGELRALATALGRVRDLDVFAAAVRRHAKAAPPADRPALQALVADLKKDKRAGQAELRTFLDGEALTYLRGGFRDALAALAARGAGRKRDSVARRAPRLIARALRRLYAAPETLLAPASTELHERRILAKRARYAGEFFAPAFGDTLTEPIARLTAVQDVLGEIHDADVATGVLLGRIEEVAGDAARAPEAAPLARLVARYLEQRDADLRTFRERWELLPGAAELKRALRRK